MVISCFFKFGKMVFKLRPTEIPKVDQLYLSLKFVMYRKKYIKLERDTIINLSIHILMFEISKFVYPFKQIKLDR